MSSYTRRALQAYGTRAGEYLRSGPGGLNVEKIVTYAMLGTGIWIGWKIYQAGKRGKDMMDDIGDAIARGVVGKPMQVQDGLFYVLPNGTRVAANSSSVQYLGNMLFMHLGIRYRLVKALGGGLYQAEKA